MYYKNHPKLMKTLLLLVACLGCATASYAQTTPAPASPPAVSGTKNVGADRADAPQAPGMSTPASPRPAPIRTLRATQRRGSAARSKAPAVPPAAH